jgi:hypothetical protein
MSDEADIRSLEVHWKELLPETTISAKQSIKEPMSEDRELSADGFSRSAGSWKGLVDPEALIAATYASRRT